MDATPIEVARSRSELLDPRRLPWCATACAPLPAEAVRTLHYMQDIESHTSIYLRSLLSTSAVDDPEVSAFLARWFYEETVHGLALARFLALCGNPVQPRRRSRTGLGERLREASIRVVSARWPDFVAVHMLWGAINELTTLTGYRRLSRLAGHAGLAELLELVVRDESRHFGFYFAQARRRLAAPRAARIARALVERFWAPVGSGVQPDSELRFLGGYLFGGPDGRRAARQVDATIRSLPGLAGLELLEAWLER